jgi:uncharacterized iron-regulated protein
MCKIIALLFLLLVMTVSVASAQMTEANYRIYDAKGNASTLQQIIDAAGKADAVFLGENHDDAVAHYLQSEILKKIFENYGKQKIVALSMEMFERDVQTILDEYLYDLITEKKFLDDSRPWNNYKTDYRPLIEFAKQNKLAVIAANAPRRYVNMVSRNGRNSLNVLSKEAKKWLAPLPYKAASEEYSQKFKALMGGMSSDNHNLSKILDSQTLWDATMAFSISEFLKRNKNALVVNLNGSFHTEKHLGTVEQLQKFYPKAKVLVVTMRYEDDFANFNKSKHSDLGDFVILTDAKVPRSFK